MDWKGLYGVKHMVEDHSDSERGNPLLPHGLLFPINSKVLLYAPSHRQDSTYHGFCYTSRGALAGTRNSSMGPPHKGSIRRPIAPWANALTTKLHLVPNKNEYRDVNPVCWWLKTLCHQSWFPSVSHWLFFIKHYYLCWYNLIKNKYDKCYIRP